jgi:hypothetical protein
VQTMKDVLASFKGKRLNVTFENGVIEISLRPDSDPAYPYYAIQEVGSEVFKMTRKGPNRRPESPGTTLSIGCCQSGRLRLRRKRAELML